MIHLLITYEGMITTTVMFTRDMDRIAELTKAFEVRACRYVDSCCAEYLNWSDVVIGVRDNSPIAVAFEKAVVESGRPFITFYDDDLAGLPKDTIIFPPRRGLVNRMLAGTSAVMSSNRHLAEKYVQRTEIEALLVRHTSVDGNSLLPPERQSDVTRILFAAGGNHEKLFEENISPILPRLFAKYGDRISVTCIGSHPRITGCEGQTIEYVPIMPFVEYREYMHTHRFDIGVAPLEDTEFHRCKYFNKFIEYTIMGIAGAYTDMPPYTDVVAPGKTGYLTKNGSENWYDCLCDMIEHPEQRRSTVLGAQELLRTEFDERALAEKFLAEMTAFLQDYPNKKKIKGHLLWAKLRYRLFRMVEVAYLTEQNLTRHGLKTVLEKIRVHMKPIRA